MCQICANNPIYISNLYPVHRGGAKTSMGLYFTGNEPASSERVVKNTSLNIRGSTRLKQAHHCRRKCLPSASAKIFQIIFITRDTKFEIFFVFLLLFLDFLVKNISYNCTFTGKCSCFPNNIITVSLCPTRDFIIFRNFMIVLIIKN